LKDDSPQLPTTSETFDQAFVDSFFETYDRVDPHLLYYTASPWEIKLNFQKSNREQLYFSKIENVDTAHFVSCTLYNYSLLDRDYCLTRIYQHKDAPVPMADWTIKSVSLVKYRKDIDIYGRKETVHEKGAQVAQNYMDAYSNDSKVYSTYDRTSNPELMSDLQDAFKNRTEWGDLHLFTVYENVGKSHGDFRLLVQFEENDNLVWVSQLYLDKNGDLYIDCTTSAVRTRSDSDEGLFTFYLEENKMCAKLNDQFAEVIKNRIPYIIKSTLPDNEE
jgi:hypothetical protein